MKRTTACSSILSLMWVTFSAIWLRHWLQFVHIHCAPTTFATESKTNYFGVSNVHWLCLFKRTKLLISILTLVTLWQAVYICKTALSTSLISGTLCLRTLYFHSLTECSSQRAINSTVLSYQVTSSLPCRLLFILCCVKALIYNNGTARLVNW